MLSCGLKRNKTIRRRKPQPKLEDIAEEVIAKNKVLNSQDSNFDDLIHGSERSWGTSTEISDIVKGDVDLNKEENDMTKKDDQEGNSKIDETSEPPVQELFQELETFKLHVEPGVEPVQKVRKGSLDDETIDAKNDSDDTKTVPKELVPKSDEAEEKDEPKKPDPQNTQVHQNKVTNEGLSQSGRSKLELNSDSVRKLLELKKSNTCSF